MPQLNGYAKHLFDQRCQSRGQDFGQGEDEDWGGDHEKVANEKHTMDLSVDDQMINLYYVPRPKLLHDLHTTNRSIEFSSSP